MKTWKMLQIMLNIDFQVLCFSLFSELCGYLFIIICVLCFKVCSVPVHTLYPCMACKNAVACINL